MHTLFIITGTSKGLGKAMATQILADNKEASILSLGRSCDETFALHTPRFRHVAVDLTQSSTLTQVLEMQTDAISRASEVIFISNAGNIAPITAIGHMNSVELIESIAINTTAPAILCNYLLRVCADKKIKLVNISSGAAIRVIDGWAAYCAGKAYAKMFFDVLTEQTKNQENIQVIQINPGVIDTDMQKEIRSANSQTFPEHSRFVQLNEEGKLLTPQVAALNVLSQITG